MAKSVLNTGRCRGPTQDQREQAPHKTSGTGPAQDQRDRPALRFTCSVRMPQGLRRVGLRADLPSIDETTAK
jgi:hypothetical protein